uniref:hypothetical protein n=2 Tax=Ruthenibacterium lactatiformans TaxID=1550024 RepID=UPI002666032E
SIIQIVFLSGKSGMGAAVYRGFPVTPNRLKSRYHAKNERMDAMYRFHQEKRIKPGLAITQRHIRLCDRHLRAAGVSSRNEFVEKAIECYAGWLDVKQNPEFFRELFEPDIGR